MRRIGIGAAVLLAATITSSVRAANTVQVKNPTELRAALAAARAGDEIVLAPGTYAISGSNLSCSASGTTASPIVVKSATPLAAKLELSTVEGFVVTGAHWHFEDLDVRGTCAVDSQCAHAFHVVGAPDFVLRKSRIVDFDAQLKVNASAGGAAIPHRGLVEGCEVYDTRARQTTSPVTKLNIDTGDGWVVRANYIHDVHRADAKPTYGAFMKSGGKNGVFERNLVVCSKDVVAAGAHIGLSFGGGGTDAQFCAPAFNADVPCAVEHEGGVMRNNVIASCDDVAIMVNRGKATKLLHNTSIATSGIDFRFETASGVVQGNVTSGRFRKRDEATFSESDNLTQVSQATFEAMYVAPLVGDLRKKGDLAALIGHGPMNAEVTDDYCARPRAGTWDLGALQHALGDCVTVPPPLGSTMSNADGGVGPGGQANGGSSGGTTSSGGASGVNGPSGAAADDGGCRMTRGGGSTSLAIVVVAFAWSLIRRRRR